MARDRSSRQRSSPHTVTLTRTVAVLLVICLIQCVAEQSINGRGIKSVNLVQKANGWRSQRGGSCLSYGHSCWGAHGKRSGPPASAPDWYLTRLLRRMVANGELWCKSFRTDSDLAYSRQQINLTICTLDCSYCKSTEEGPKSSQENNDLNAIFRVDTSDDSAQNRLTDMDDASPEDLGSKRTPEGIPMIDDDMLSKSKVWQIMRAASKEN